MRFRVRPRSGEVLDCNCSVCDKKGILHLIAAPEDFELVQGSTSLTTYTFNTHTAKHLFCATCGIHPFYRPRSHPDQWDVNVRCLDVDWRARFEVTPFDGRNWEGNISRIR